jgi:signal transduction histidine kinase
VRDALLQLSHDVRHSVGTILALVDATRHDISADSATRQFLDGIENEASSIAALCRSVLSGEPATCLVRVDELVRRVVDTATSDFRGRVDFSLSAVSTTCDVVALSRLLRNLTQNACRAAGPSGRVALGVRQYGGTIVIDVNDSGLGFGKLTREGGLGLAIVQSAADALEGSVSIAEDPTGTSVVVTIPVVQPASSSPIELSGRSA